MTKRFLIILFTIFLANCAIGPTHGLLVTINKFPGEFNPGNDVSSTKSATGCQHSILGLIAWGSAGVGRIAKDNGILRVSTVDHSTLNILSVVYSNYCTTIWGDTK
ncbi:MAG: TRL-like family protein [Leptospiraceae bacterium]|nr:TRL-like family protein [Leptospiraceae bacterium]